MNIINTNPVPMSGIQLGGQLQENTRKRKIEDREGEEKSLSNRENKKSRNGDPLANPTQFSKQEVDGDVEMLDTPEVEEVHYIVSLGNEMMGLMAQYMPFREARNFFKEMRINDFTQLRACAKTSYSLADMIHYVSTHWNHQDQKKREESQRVIGEFFSVLDQDRHVDFFEAIYSFSLEIEPKELLQEFWFGNLVAPRKFLSYFLESLPEKTFSISFLKADFIYKPNLFGILFFAEEHLVSVINRFSNLKKLAINPLKITANGFPENPNMEQWQSLELNFPRNNNMGTTLACYENAFHSLITSRYLKRLEDLTLHWATCRMVQSLSLAGTLENLHTLKFLSRSREPSIRGGVLADLFAANRFKNLQCLDISDCTPNDKEFSTILESLCDTQLRELHCGQQDRFNDQTLALIADCANLRHLQTLEFGYSRNITDAGVASIANSPYLQQLQSFTFSGFEQLTDVAIAAIAQSRYMGRLTELVFPCSHTKMTDNALISIARSPFMKKLEKLSCTLGGDNGITELAKSENTNRLLDLSIRADMSEIGARAFTHSLHLKSLQKLSIYGSLSENTIIELFSGVNFLHLNELFLCHHDHLTDAAVAALTRNPAVRNISDLTLLSNKMTDESLVSIATSPFIKSLTSFNLSRCSGFTKLGIKAIAESENMGHLRSLQLETCGEIDHEAIVHIANGGSLKELRVLNLPGESWKASSWEAVALSTTLRELRNIIVSTWWRDGRPLRLTHVQGIDSAKNPQAYLCRVEYKD